MGLSLIKCNVCNTTPIVQLTNDKKDDLLKIKILFLGLDNSGKTSTVKSLRGESIDDVMPTVGFSNVEMKSFHRFNVTIYDLGGGHKIRGIWKNYFALAHGIVFVIDSTDRDRLLETKQVFTEVVSHPKIVGKPVLVLINKQDEEKSIDEIDVLKLIDLETLINQYQCPTKVEACSAKTKEHYFRVDPAIDSGYQWMLKFIEKNWDSLNDRVAFEAKLQYDSERKIMEERIRKFRKLKQSNAVNGNSQSNHDSVNSNEKDAKYQPLKEVLVDIKQINKVMLITEAMKPDQTKRGDKSNLLSGSPSAERDVRSAKIAVKTKNEKISEIQDVEDDIKETAQGVDEVVKILGQSKQKLSEPNVHSDIKTQIRRSVSLGEMPGLNDYDEKSPDKEWNTKNRESLKKQKDETKQIVTNVSRRSGDFKRDMVTLEGIPPSHGKDKKTRTKLFNRNRVSPADDDLPPLKSPP